MLTLHRALATIILVFCVAAPVAAATYEDAQAAFITGDDATARRLARPLAEEGNADAQLILGMIFGEGRGVPQNDTAAVKWFRKAANQGQAVAQFQLGVMYLAGRGGPQDFVLGYMWLNLSSAKGNENAAFVRNQISDRLSLAQIEEAQNLARKWKPESIENQNNEPASSTTIDPFEVLAKARPEDLAKARTFADGAAAYNRGDYAVALRVFLPLADQGFSPAQGILGIMYEQGQGTPQDTAEAVKWLRLAANHGNSIGQLGLGAMYSKGNGLPQNDAEAAKWYQLAADQGVAMAQYNLAVRYYQGRGVSQNFIFAYVWFNLAAVQNYADAAKNRDLAGQRLTAAQIAEAQKLAREWKTRN